MARKTKAQIAAEAHESRRVELLTQRKVARAQFAEDPSEENATAKLAAERAVRQFRRANRKAREAEQAKQTETESSEQEQPVAA